VRTRALCLPSRGGGQGRREGTYGRVRGGNDLGLLPNWWYRPSLDMNQMSWHESIFRAQLKPLSRY
jgi:hypothetical protein